MENGGNQPPGSVAQVYISRKNDERGIRSVEAEFKRSKIKAAVKLFDNSDTSREEVWREGSADRVSLNHPRCWN